MTTLPNPPPSGSAMDVLSSYIAELRLLAEENDEVRVYNTDELATICDLAELAIEVRGTAGSDWDEQDWDARFDAALSHPGERGEAGA